MIITMITMMMLFYKVDIHEQVKSRNTMMINDDNSMKEMVVGAEMKMKYLTNVPSAIMM